MPISKHPDGQRMMFLKCLTIAENFKCQPKTLIIMILFDIGLLSGLYTSILQHSNVKSHSEIIALSSQIESQHMSERCLSRSHCERNIFARGHLHGTQLLKCKLVDFSQHKHSKSGSTHHTLHTISHRVRHGINLLQDQERC
jgi:hypothetical protein